MTSPQRMAVLSIVAAIVTLALKFGAYYATDSVSLFSDALESFVNLATGILALIVLTLAAQPPDEKHPYGHEKAEYFSSGVEGALIFFAALSIFYTSIERLFHPTELTSIIPGLILALAATAVNLGTAWKLMKEGKAYDSITLEANAKHVLTDVWTTVGVIIALVIILFAPPAWKILDPIVAMIIASHILYTGFKLMHRSFDGLMDAALPEADIKLIETAISGQLPQSATVTALRTRKSGSRRFVEFKLILPGYLSVTESHQICDKLEDSIEGLFERTSITIHVEPRKETSWS